MSDDELVTVGHPREGMVRVATALDEFGEPCEWRTVPAAHAAQWDVRNWR
jgi:hypothetical protein